MSLLTIFKCIRCGQCCKGQSTISLTKEELHNIATFLEIPYQEFLKKYTVKKHPNRIEFKTKEGYCIFFDKKERICLIHPVKPEKCKEWPFVKAFFKDKENFEIIKSSCPGLKDLSWEELKILKIQKQNF